MEAHASVVLGLVEEKQDIFLHEIVAELASRGIPASSDMVRSLLARHGITRKKRRWSPLNKSARTLSKRGCDGVME